MKLKKLVALEVTRKEINLDCAYICVILKNKTTAVFCVVRLNSVLQFKAPKQCKMTLCGAAWINLT